MPFVPLYGTVVRYFTAFLVQVITLQPIFIQAWPTMNDMHAGKGGNSSVHGCFPAI